MLRLHRDSAVDSSLWGLVLAAGDGKRLQSFIRERHGESLPKQYVNFFGRGSMLEQTFERTQRLIPPKQILTVIAKHHLHFAAVRQQLARRRPDTIVVQPQNRETAPGILLPLMHLYKRSPQAIVALFPSDHFILEEDRFMDHVGLAARAVRHDPTQIVLLGVEAFDPETEYGYILPDVDSESFNLWGLRRAAQFVEKPDFHKARRLVRAGALWNTMVMVFKVSTVLQLMEKHCAPLYLKFMSVFDALGTRRESEALAELYGGLEPLNFSSGFLEKIAAEKAEALSVLPVLQVRWSDWGSPQRLEKAVKLWLPTVRQPQPSARRPAQPPEPPIARLA
ncbi:MAG TPA: sugar phosphate nucleotidyltransferase [Candidatus Binatia bacterium]|nr:sugar phosphate nucleotidyltransferase [Candidatus Binatia bacterium]